MTRTKTQTDTPAATPSGGRSTRGGSRTAAMPGSAGIAAGSSTAGEQETPLAAAGQRTAETATNLAQRVTDTGIDQVDRGREEAAKTLGQLATTMRRASGEIADEQPIARNVTETLAEQTDRFAGYLRQTDTRQIIRTVEDLARQQPILFLGGAFVLGLIGARFIKVMTDGDAAPSQSMARPIGSDRMPVPVGATEV